MKKVTKNRLKVSIKQLFIMFLLFIAIHYWQTRTLIPIDSQIPHSTLSRLLNTSPINDEREKILYLFAPWCGVCKFTTPAVKQFASWVGTKSVVGVGFDFPDLDTLKAYATENEIDFSLIAADDESYQDFQITTFPTIYYLDDQGVIKSHTTGFTTSIVILVRWLIFL